MFVATHETIVCDVPRPHVARITLNREKVMNAYSWRMTQELQAAIADYRDDDELKALVLTGAGGRAFCTGGDVSGTVTLNHLQLLNDGQVQGGTYSFQVSLPRSATGLSKFTITVSAQDNATNAGMASANVIVAPLIISP